MSARGKRGMKRLRLPEVQPASPRLAETLTDFEAIQIIGALRCGTPPRVIEWEFQICSKTLNNLAAGRSFKHLPRPQLPSTAQKLKPYDIAVAVDLIRKGLTLGEAADQIGISHTNLARRLRERRAEQGISGDWVDAQGTAWDLNCPERPVSGPCESDHRTLRQIQLQTEEIIEVLGEISDGSGDAHASNLGGNE